MNDPGKREVTWEQVKNAYQEQVAALIEGGVDLLLVETTFDTLNLKAALFAIEEHFEKLGYRLPVMASGTITDASGRTLTGQTTEAFWISISHAPLLSVGLNCALGPKELRPYIEELARIAPIYVFCYPNAGLPDPLSPTGFPETPGDACAPTPGMGGTWMVKHRRRLLRDDSGPHCGDRKGRKGSSPAQGACSASDDPVQRP